MKIVVTVKHVPDVQSERRIDGNRVVRGLDDVLNELDENAVEAAVALAENTDATVVALTMGPDDADDALRRALQIGADQAVHVLDDRCSGADVAMTAKILAAAIAKIGADEPVDLVVTGMAAMDGLTAMLPGALAQCLELPALTLASDVALDGHTIVTTSTVTGATERYRASLPALVSVTDQANEPRIPNFKSMMAAKKKPIATYDLDDLGLDDVTPAVRLVSAVAKPPRESGVIVADTGQAGAALVDWLRERKVI